MKFTATIERYGTKRGLKGYEIKTVLIVNVKNLANNNVVTDHLWFTCGKSWEPFKEGDYIEFKARVNGYEKGYKEDIFIKKQKIIIRYLSKKKTSLGKRGSYV